jgi:NAD(P)-dependent dehydrogenase (short-subunit alcohol dehydrogenase family)
MPTCPFAPLFRLSEPICAGIFMMKLITEVTEEEYDRLMMINVKGTYFAARFAAEIMRKNNARGSIINLSSIAGINGFGDMSTY